MWVARSPCGPTGGTTLRAPMASSGWWTAPTGSACRTAYKSSRACWWRSAWPEQPSSSLPTSRTCLGHCPLMPFARPWNWTPFAATTGASRAAAPSPGRTCCWALTGSWMTFQAASSQPTEPPWTPTSQSRPSLPAPQPRPYTIRRGWESASWANTPRPLHILLLLLLPTAAPGPVGSRDRRPAALAATPTPHLAPLGLPH